MSFVIFMSFHISIFYKIKLVYHVWIILEFFSFLNISAMKKCSYLYHYYPMIKIHLYQVYFNTSCHWHISMSCLIRFHVNMLIVRKIVNKGVHVSENGKMILHSTCENNYDGVIMILFIISSISFFTFPNHVFCSKTHEFVQIYMISCNYKNIMWKLYV
jgi:hypothetical protein